MTSSSKGGMNLKIVDFILEYLEEILMMLGFLFFIIFGFLISIKIGFLLLSVSFFAISAIVIKYKKLLSNDE